VTGPVSFDEKAREWDTPERVERAREVARFVREHVALTSDMRVIDIGSGTGLLGLELAPHVGEMVLTDPSEGMLETTRAKLADLGLPNVTAKWYDLPGDPPAGSPFDLAVSLMALHHVEDTEAALRSIHALLAPRGGIALMDLDAEDGSFHDETADGVHHHGFERAGLVAQAESVGFVDLGTSIAFEVERHGRPYPVFLLTGRKA
jgi:ubiquinone/menaquinone biosynthesis C-methylase UbiE